jgi:hypothetical protein
MQHLVENASASKAATDAVLGIAQALGADAIFTVWNPDRTIAFSVGEPLPSPELRERQATAHLFDVAITSKAGHLARLRLRPKAANEFTPRDLKIFDTSVSTFATWFAAEADRIGSAQASMLRSFDDVVDRYVRDVGPSASAALILVMPAHDVSSRLTYEWIRRLRSQLRLTDLAGRLTTGEIAIVAAETGLPGAQVVARRVARVLNVPTGQRVRVGLSSHEGTSVSGPSLIAEARRHILQM